MREAAQAVADTEVDDPEDYSFREPIQSIFRADGEFPIDPLTGEIIPPMEQPAAQPRQEGGGFFQIFKRRRQ